uniref:Uncharacterized protein n=1 Tax=Mycena chlorophos TaxID=658473 RepID=A0ABQ0L1X7_MYCCL|nr:predicted protein [Mycena chlorophos]
MFSSRCRAGEGDCRHLVVVDGRWAARVVIAEVLLTFLPHLAAGARIRVVDAAEHFRCVIQANLSSPSAPPTSPSAACGQALCLEDGRQLLPFFEFIHTRTPYDILGLVPFPIHLSPRFPLRLVSSTLHGPYRRLLTRRIPYCRYLLSVVTTVPTVGSYGSSLSPTSSVPRVTNPNPERLALFIRIVRRAAVPSKPNQEQLRAVLVYSLPTS